MKRPVSLLCALEYIDHFGPSCPYQVLLDKVSHRGLNSGKLHAAVPYMYVLVPRKLHNYPPQVIQGAHRVPS